MKKSQSSRWKDALSHKNEVWVRDPKCNVRQASGVTFGGKWVDAGEYRRYLRRKERERLERLIEKGGEDDGN